MPRVKLDSNIDDVIDSIGDVKNDIRKTNDAVRRVMDIVAEDARAYIRADADHTGQLRRSIGVQSEPQGHGEQRISVVTDAEIAPYAALIEFGTGTKTDIAGPGAVTPPPPDTGSSRPKGMPYDTPPIPFNAANPFDMGGYPKFYGFVKHIEEWMESKPVEPMFDLQTSAVLIARELIESGQYAHPFLRPAWFHNELYVKQAARNAIRRAVR